MKTYTKVIFRLSMISLLMLFMAGNLFSAPAYPFLIELEQPDGTTLEAYLSGDEHFSYYTTTDGYVIIQSQDDYYVYADQLAGSQNLIPSNFIVNNEDRRTYEETTFLKNIPKGLTRKQRDYQTMEVMAARIKMAAEMGHADGNLKSSTGVAYVPRTGNPHFLVLLFNYADVHFTFSRDDFSRMLNEEGYNADGATGSAADFFKASSWNQLKPVYDVVGPIQLPGNRAEYGGTGGDASKMFTQGVVIAHNQFNVDFSKYDFDNDGVVDNVYGFFAGYDRAQGGPAECVWSHASGIRHKNIQLNGVYIGSYACSSELKWNSGANRVGIGTFVHEFGHVLGLPDLYDTDGDANGKGHSPGGWSTMAGGAYNNDSRTPPSFGIMEREMLGWCSIPTCPAGSVTLNRIQHSKDAPGYKINSPTPNEFYVLEYREKVGFDSSLPGSGMLIWHVDKSDNHVSFVSGSNTYDFTYNNLWGWNSVNNVAGHPCYDLVESSGSSVSGGDVSLNASHMWPNGSNNFNPHSWAGLSCNSPLTNIVNHGNHATFTCGNTCSVETSPLATFYYDSDYRGTAVGLPEGRFTRGQMAEYCLTENVISSIKVLPGYKVTIYSEDNFTGSSQSYTSNSNYVGNALNDKTSSIVIEALGVSGFSGVYKIKGRNSGKYMDMDGNSTNNTTKVVQWDDEGSEVYQQFKFNELENGVYSITSVPSGRVFDIADFSSNNGAELQIHDSNFGANQQFILIDAGDGYHQLVARHCGKVLEVPGNSMGSGEWIKIYDNNNQGCSHWRLEKFNPNYWIVNKEDLDGIDSYIDLRHNDVLVWGNLDGTATNGAFEGSEAISFIVSESAKGAWFGFGVHNNYQTHDFSGLSNLAMHFAIKTDYKGLLGIKLTGATETEPIVNLSGGYAIETNNTWQEVVIPMSAFTDQDLVLGSLTNNVIFSIVSENVTTSGARIEVDNIYFGKVSAPKNALVSPNNKSIEVGGNVTFTVNASGIGLSYQWKKDGVNINGATGTTLSFEGAGRPTAGVYVCEVKNQGGTVLSNEVVLTVDYPTYGIDITDNGGVITASHNGIKSDEDVDAVIDNDATTKYCSAANAGSGIWISYESTQWVVPSSYSITSANDFPDRDPKKIIFQGSESGIDWVELDRQEELEFKNRFERKTFALTTSVPFKFFRLLVTERKSANVNTFQLAEWQIFGEVIVWSDIFENAIDKINVYPNPVGDVFFIDMPVSGNITVLDLNGRAIRSEFIQSGIQQVHVSDLERGIYLLKINIEKQIKTILITK